MTDDISPILSAWPYEPGKINVRVITGEDGQPRIQVRVGLGILQMTTEGRPDGLRPEGFESYLEYQESRLEEAEEGDEEESFRLRPEECHLLREEAVLYYQRYVALLVMQDFEGVVRDTTRNLRVLDMLAQYAEQESDRISLEGQRASIITIRARALAGQAFQVENQRPAALWAIEHAMGLIRERYEAAGRGAELVDLGEMNALRAIRDSLEPKLPMSQRAELERRLDEAIVQENYRLAAILRDELKQLDDSLG